MRGSSRTVGLIAAVASLFATWSRAELPAPDDVLLDHFGGKIQQFRAGVLIDTFASTTSSWAGVAATPSGVIATVYRSPTIGLALFAAAGQSTGEPAVVGIVIPTDVDVFADQTFVVADQNGDVLKLVSAAGQVVGTFSTATMDGPFGVDVAADDTVWVANRFSEDVDHFSREGNDLGGFALGFEPGEVVVDPEDGSLWIAEALTGTIQHRSAVGQDLGSLATGITASDSIPLQGLAITSDGILLVVDKVGSKVLRFTRSGVPDGFFAIPQPDTPFRMITVPEPLGGIGALVAVVALLVVARAARGGARHA